LGRISIIMHSRGFALVAVVGLAVVTTAATRVEAQEHIALPSVNLGGSSFMDAVGGPGLLVRQAVGVYEAQRFLGSNGAGTRGSNSVFAFTSITHVAYAPPFKVLGGYWGVEVLVPVVYASVTTPVGSGSVGGVGDITFSPVVWQAPTATILGRPFFQFVDLNLVAPTGEYKRTALVTAGSNVWSFNPFYAFTWLLTDRLEASWRLHYLWNSANNSPGSGYGATSIQPGQAVHFNGAASFELVPWLRAGVAGYFLRQITDSRANGVAVTGSREQAAAIGPGLLASARPFQFVLNGYAEFAAENRSEGLRLSAYAMGVW
jgi:hypothetical protein